MYFAMSNKWIQSNKQTPIMYSLLPANTSTEVMYFELCKHTIHHEAARGKSLYRPWGILLHIEAFQASCQFVLRAVSIRHVVNRTGVRVCVCQGTQYRWVFCTTAWYGQGGQVVTITHTLRAELNCAVAISVFGSRFHIMPVVLKSKIYAGKPLSPLKELCREGQIVLVICPRQRPDCAPLYRPCMIHPHRQNNSHR